MPISHRTRTALKFLLVYLGISCVVGLVLVGLAYPKLPNTPSQWLAILVLPIPAYLAFELVGGLVFGRLHDNRVTRYVEGKTVGKSFSWFRIVYNLMFFLLLIGMLIGAVCLWRTFWQA